MAIVELADKPMSILKVAKVYFPEIASTYAQQLSDFIIPVTQLQLIEMIGQGIAVHVMVTVDLI